MDKISIKRLVVFANHGALKEERELGQKFVVSADLYFDARKAGGTDLLADTVDYGKICFRIQRFLTEHTYQLIEMAAEELAKELLYSVPQIRSLQIELEKPWAPIGLPLESVSVTIRRGWHEAYIALGSNMGDKEAYLRHGVEALGKSKDFRVKATSKFLTTKPYGVKEQDNFLNGCMKVETLLMPEELLEFLQGVERSVNRVREGKWGPRTLDLDLIFYDDLIMDTASLKIPHVDMHNRDFVLVPMQQIAPNYCHPVLKKTINMLVEEYQGETTILPLSQTP